jgi:hypothetical protein
LSSRPKQIIAKAMIRGVEGPAVLSCPHDSCPITVCYVVVTICTKIDAIFIPS